MNARIKHPEAVFFDWDGTLVDSYGFLNEAHSYVLKRLDFPPFKNDEFKEYFGKPREILYTTIYKHRSEDAKTLFEKYVTENTDKLNFMPAADQILDLLAFRKTKLGVVSNKKGSIVRREIEKFGWSTHFTVVVAAGESAADKPSGEPLLKALKMIEYTEKRKAAWYVGDTEIDMKCAQEAGCPAVLLTAGEDMSTIKREYNPILSLENCQELYEFLVALDA